MGFFYKTFYNLILTAHGEQKISIEEFKEFLNIDRIHQQQMFITEVNNRG